MFFILTIISEMIQTFSVLLALAVCLFFLFKLLSICCFSNLSLLRGSMVGLVATEAIHYLYHLHPSL